MKKILLVMIALLGISLGAWAQSGSWDDVVNRDLTWGTDYATATSFTVETAAQLAQFAYMVNNGNNFEGKTITLAQDIDLGIHYWVPIGSRLPSENNFVGTFDGAGYTVSGMRINDADYDYMGLFGYSCYDSSTNPKNKICRVNLVNSTLTGKVDVGGIVGWNAGIIEDCHVADDVSLCFGRNNSTNYGGIAGQNCGESSDRKAVIKHCSSKVNIFATGFTGARSCGGIAGHNSFAEIDSSLCVGSSVAGEYQVGAIVGSNGTDGSLTCNYYRTYVGSDLKGIGKSDGREGDDTDDGALPTQTITFGDDGFSLYSKTLVYNGIMKVYEEGFNKAAMVYNNVVYVPSGKEIAITHTAPAEGYDYQMVLSDNNASQDPYRGLVRIKPGNDDLTITFESHKAFDGEGTAESPYLIQSVADMNTLSHMTNDFLQYNFEDTYFKLTSDLEFDGTENNFVPISYLSTYIWTNGYYGDFIRYFAGHFDGDGHTISGINTKHTGNSDEEGFGLFGKVQEGSVKNLTLTNSTFIGGVDREGYTGGIVGFLVDGTVENCHVASSVEIKPDRAGTTFTEVGGIVGYSQGTSTVKGCTNASTIQINKGNYSYWVGGIIGHISGSSTMQDCLYLGSSFDLDGVSYPMFFGSLIGENVNSPTLINNFYNAGTCTMKAVAGYSERDPVEDYDGACAAYVMNIAEATYLGNTLDLLEVGNATTTTYPVFENAPSLIAYDGILAYDGKYYVKPAASVAFSTGDKYNADITVATAEATGNSFIMPEAEVTVSATNIARKEWGGKGTEANPYTIPNVAAMNALAEEVNGSNVAVSFAGQFFKMTADIDYSSVPSDKDNGYSNYAPIGYTKANSERKFFGGSFNGDGHTLSGLKINTPTDGRITQGVFGLVGDDYAGPAVRNLKLANSSITAVDNTYIGGIVAGLYNNAVVDSCEVADDVRFGIHSSTPSKVAIGGIVGESAGNVSNCFVQAQFDLGSEASAYNAGAIAGVNGGTITKNYYRVSNTDVRGVGASDSFTGTDAEGAQAALTLTFADAEGGVSSTDTEATFTHDGNAYYVAGDQAHLVYTPTGSSHSGYTFSATGTGATVDGYLLTFGTGDVVIATTVSESLFIGDGSEGEPYQIWTTVQMNKLAQDIKNGPWEDYIGKHFKLMDDLQYDYDTENNYVPVGYLSYGSFNARKNYFGGIFDGCGHTISGVRVATTANSHPVGIFGAVIGGTVKNLTVEHCKFEKVGGSSMDFGPIAGWMEESTSLVENCHVGDDVMISIDNFRNALNTGGIVGRVENGIVRGCTSKAWWQVVDQSINPDQGYTFHEVRFGGIAGSAISATLSDCLYLNDAQDMSYVCVQGILVDNQGATVTRCYFTCKPDDSKARFVSFPDTYEPDAFSINNSAYQNDHLEGFAEGGVLYQGMLYIGKNESLSLTYSGALANGDNMADGCEIVCFEEGNQMTGTGGTIDNPTNTTATLTLGESNVNVVASLVLDAAAADEDANYNKLLAHDGEHRNVTVRNINVYADDAWNTLCLPFDISTDASGNAGHIAGSIVSKAEIKTLASSSFDNGTLTMNFASATTLPAGTPCLIKMTGSYVWQAPVFLGVTVRSDKPAVVETENVSFCGGWEQTTLLSDDNTKLFMAAENKMYYPTADVPVGGFHAYFQLDGLTASDLDPNPAHAFVLNFIDDDPTAITGQEMVNGQSSMVNDSWYTLDGRRLSGKPTEKGIYINNGKKIAIK